MYGEKMGVDFDMLNMAYYADEHSEGIQTLMHATSKYSLTDFRYVGFDDIIAGMIKTSTKLREYLLQPVIFLTKHNIKICNTLGYLINQANRVQEFVAWSHVYPWSDRQVNLGQGFAENVFHAITIMALEDPFRYIRLIFRYPFRDDTMDDVKKILCWAIVVLRKKDHRVAIIPSAVARRIGYLIKLEQLTWSSGYLILRECMQRSENIRPAVFDAPRESLIIIWRAILSSNEVQDCHDLAHRTIKPSPVWPVGMPKTMDSINRISTIYHQTIPVDKGIRGYSYLPKNSQYLGREWGRISTTANKVCEVIAPIFSELDPQTIMCLAEGSGSVIFMLSHLFPRAFLFYNTLIRSDVQIRDNIVDIFPPALESDTCEYKSRMVDPNPLVKGVTDILDPIFIAKFRAQCLGFPPGLVTIDAEPNNDTNCLEFLITYANLFGSVIPRDCALIVKMFNSDVKKTHQSSIKGSIGERIKNVLHQANNEQPFKQRILHVGRLNR